MALLRKELVDKNIGGLDVFDFLVEEDDDFTDDAVLSSGCGIGSMAYCLEDGKVYVKNDDGWEAATT